MRLIGFELRKMWGRRGVAALFAGLLAIYCFMLWYTNLPREGEPPLSAYRTLENDLSEMDDAERLDYLGEMNALLDDVSFARDILYMQEGTGGQWADYARQQSESRPGVFERCLPLYQSGEYLVYTQSLDQERALIGQAYSQAAEICGYGEYIRSAVQTAEQLESVSIFSAGADDYSRRNIEKSAADYSALAGLEPGFTLSKGVLGAAQDRVLDALLFVAAFALAGGTLHEERRRRLPLITRSTAMGRLPAIMAKLAALLISCAGVTAVMYGVNLACWAATTGVGDLLVPMQSAVPFMTSTRSLSMLGFLLLSVLMKAAVLFGFGALVMLAAILSRHETGMYIAGAGILAISGGLYLLVPAYSSLNALKYLNLVGLFDTRSVLGQYLNLNILGYPVSRVWAALVLLAALIALGCLLCAAVWLRCGDMSLRQLANRRKPARTPRLGLFGHESYKLLITGRALAVLLLFAALIGYYHLSETYSPSVGERYYRSFIGQLEGELSDEKEQIIADENDRFEAAFAELERIDALEATGELDAYTADAMRTVYYGETALYPAFERVLEQYESIKLSGGRFVYDTGCSYLFGLAGEDDAIDYLLMTLCVLGAFGGAFTMEHQCASSRLLAATAAGRRRVRAGKLLCCLLCSGAMCLLLVVVRWARISRSFPIHGPLLPLDGLPAFRESGIGVPVIVWAAVMLLSQLLAVWIILRLTLAFSDLVKSHSTVLAAAGAVFVVPPLLYQMGISAAGRFTLLRLWELASLQ